MQGILFSLYRKCTVVCTKSDELCPKLTGKIAAIRVYEGPRRHTRVAVKLECDIEDGNEAVSFTRDTGMLEDDDYANPLVTNASHTTNAFMKYKVHEETPLYVDVDAFECVKLVGNFAIDYSYIVEWEELNILIPHGGDDDGECKWRYKWPIKREPRPIA